jgi:hypothetical protein
VDANQGELVEVARACGCSVAYTFRLGGGFPDLVLGIDRMFNLLIEAKRPGGHLTPDEAWFRDSWKGQYDTVYTAEQLASIVRKWRRLGDLLRGQQGGDCEW